MKVGKAAGSSGIADEIMEISGKVWQRQVTHITKTVSYPGTGIVVSSITSRANKKPLNR